MQEKAPRFSWRESRKQSAGAESFKRYFGEPSFLGYV